MGGVTTLRGTVSPIPGAHGNVFGAAACGTTYLFPCCVSFPPHQRSKDPIKNQPPMGNTQSARGRLSRGSAMSMGDSSAIAEPSPETKAP